MLFPPNSALPVGNCRFNFNNCCLCLSSKNTSASPFDSWQSKVNSYVLSPWICPHVWPNQCRNPVLPCLHLSLVEIHTKLPVCFLIPQDLWYTEDTSQCRIAIWRSISTSPWHVLLSNSALYSKLADHSLFDNAMRKIDVGLNHYTWLPCILQVPMIKRKKMWRKNAPHRP